MSRFDKILIVGLAVAVVWLGYRNWRLNRMIEGPVKARIEALDRQADSLRKEIRASRAEIENLEKKWRHYARRQKKLRDESDAIHFVDTIRAGKDSLRAILTR